MRPAVLLSISLALAAGVGCGRSAGPPPAVELDLQGHRGLEQRDGGWTRVFRSGEAPVLLVRPGADESGSLRLTGWIATTGGDAAWSLGDPAPPTDHGFDEIDGVLRAVIPADELGLADDLDATLVLVALRGEDRRAHRFVEESRGLEPEGLDWPSSVTRATFPMRLASRKARAAGASAEVAACRAAYSEEPERTRELCEAAATDARPHDRMLALERLGLHLRREGKLADARASFEAAADSALTSGLPADQTTELRLAAQCAREAGDFAAARGLAEAALAVDTEHGHLLWQSRDRMYLGQLAYQLGDASEAVDSLLRAVDAAELLDRPYDQANALTELAMVYRGSGRYRHALATLDRARPLLEPGDDASAHEQEAWATYLGNRGWVLLRARRRGLLPATTGELTEGFAAARAIHREAGLVLWEANEAMNQATLALQEGDAAAARTRMEEARSLLGEGATFEHAGYLLALEGELALVEGKPSTALARFDRLQGVEGRWSARWWADFGRARALAAAGRDSDADEAFERALDALEGGAAALDPLVGRPYFLGDRDEVYDRYLLHLLDRGRVTEAFAVSERSRTRATRRDRGLVRGTDEELGGLLDRVVLARAALREHEEGEAFVGPEGRGAWEGDRRDRIDALVRAQAALAAAERERVPGETSPTDPAAEAVAAVGQLGSSARLLAYHATASELVLFAVGGSGIVAFREPVGRLDLEAGVDVWRIAVGAGGGDPAADALGDLLLPAELERIPDGLLVIAPHGPLHGLSFPLLRRDGRFLVEDHPLSMVPGASALTAALASPPCTGGGAVVAADPDGDLRFAREEGRDVASRSEGAELLLGDQIDSAAVREALARACSFHFAGHAVVDPDLPQHSHLRLAGGDRLTWIDLQSLEVRPDLVVLSACETGRGMTPAAGERWGLATGFLAAGASTVVASGWRVPDKPSGALMARFYDELAIAGPAQALRSAQRALLAGEAGADAASPASWGAFSLFGNPGVTAPTSVD